MVKKLKFMATGAEYVVDKIGYFTPKMVNTEELKTGEIGFIITGMKTIHDCKVGDTILDVRGGGDALPGFKPSIPVVFSSFFPVEADDYPALRESAEKLALMMHRLCLRRKNHLRWALVCDADFWACCIWKS